MKISAANKTDLKNHKLIKT